MRNFYLFIDEYFEETLVVCILLFLVFSVNIEVFRRYVLNASGAYSEEISRFALIWLVYLGVPWAVKRKRHIVCDVIPSNTPPKLVLMVNMVSNLLFIFFAVMMIIGDHGLIAQQIMVKKKTEAMHLPMWWFSTGIGIGFFLAIIRLIQTMVGDVLDFRRVNRIPEKDTT